MNKNISTVVFASNFFNSHQAALADAMYKLLGDKYCFIETSEVSVDRKKQGMKMPELPGYVIPFSIYKNNPEQFQDIVDHADIVIFGSTPYNLVKTRIKENRLTFRYSERPLKKGIEILKYPIRLIRWHRWHPKNKNIFLLCSSAYTAYDYSMFGIFMGRGYKWGYFPEVKKYADVQAVIQNKKPRSLLWVARLLSWKHPEAAVEVAKRLKEDGYSFELNIIGNGELEDQLQASISAQGLSDCVHMLGTMQPEQVREHMEKSEVFLFTSDRQEGWGAVLNESMNSACAVVASHAIGSVPFLIEDGKNGLIFKDGDTDDLYQKVKWLLDHEVNRRKIAENAYAAMTEQWNAEVAAERLLKMAEQIKMHGSCDLYEDGPCSRAGLLQNNWYKATGKNL